MCIAIVAVASIAFSHPDPIYQIAPAEPAKSSSTAIGLVASGAVSLGAYQAGFLYLTTEIKKRYPENNQPLKLVTGASAGSTNALVTGIENCQPSRSEPDQSLGWRIWIPIGFADIWDPKNVQTNGVLSNQAMKKAFSKLSPELSRGLPKECDFVAGFTATRVHPLNVSLTPGLRVPRQEDKFVVRVQGQGIGTPVRISNYVDPYQSTPMPLLPLTGAVSQKGAAKDYALLSKVLFASAAFPLAFAPVRISYCLTTPPSQYIFIPRLDTSCTKPNRSDEFIDGGVFDNSPLHLAYSLARSGLRTSPNGLPEWRNLEVSSWLDSRPLFSDIYFGYVDPWTRAYPEIKLPSEKPKKTTLKYIIDLAANFVGASRARELFNLTKVHDRIKRQVLLSQNHFPPAGDLFYAFFGFFERDLRIFDFYLGMYDALVLIQEKRPDIPILNKLDLTHGSWRPFACMLSWFNSNHKSLRHTCQDDSLSNFRILIQVSLERVYQNCSKLSSTEIRLGPKHYHCEAASSGLRPPQLIYDRGKDWESYDLSTTRGLLDRLSDLAFAFKDLGLNPSQASRIRSVLKQHFVQIAHDTADIDQNSSIRGVLKVGSSVVANETLGYESPPWMIPITIGTDAIETGLIFAPFSGAEGWLRLNLALQLRNWTNFLPGEERYVALSTLFGPEFLLTRWTSGILQPSVGLRAGYQLSSGDQFATKRCQPSLDRTDHRGCSQILTQAFIALGIVDRVRLQLQLDFFPEPPGKVRENNNPSAFNNYPVQLSVSGGITFF
ncbi:MAG: patatin-like phospholipase family protein [Myxococcales bacterium]|nr:patatin-like phospholipase family protein [Myxococcales bacterium]